MNSGNLRGLGPWFGDVAKHIIALGVFSGVGAVWGFIHKWDIRIIAAILGLMTVQTVLSLMLAYYAIRKAKEKERAQLAEEQKKEIARILSDGESRVQNLISQFSRDFQKRTEEHHWFVHAARDLSVKMMQRVEPPGRNRKGQIVPAEYLPMLEEMLRRMANTFQIVAGEGVKVFSAVRERRGQEYYTLLRAGRVDNEARQHGSKPLHSQMKMVSLLRDQFRKGDCVLLTGAGLDNWQKLDNDNFDEDKSVLMGAVFSKRWNPRIAKFEPVNLEWILCVAANKAGTFNESHKSLMKCFNDTFGLVLNIILRQGGSGSSYGPPGAPLS